MKTIDGRLARALEQAPDVALGLSHRQDDGRQGAGRAGALLVLRRLGRRRDEQVGGTLAGSGRGPRRRPAAVPEMLLTGCGAPADDRAAFYCPGDDTIYVAQRFAADLYQRVVRGLPGESAGYGRAAGDFAVAYVLAHEYAHNLQQELGIFDNSVTESAKPFELQADCLAGAWAQLSGVSAGRLWRFLAAPHL